MPRNPTLFTIEIPVTKKIMDRAVEASTYELEDYAPEHFKAAGLSARKLRSELATDERFRKELSRQMIDTARQSILDAFTYSDISVADHPILEAALKRLDRAVQIEEEQESKKREAERIKNATELLKAAGFRVERA